MNQFTIISLLLLILVTMDACGDAFRFNGKQIIHHIAEITQIAGWIALWALFPFDWHYIIMYLMGRIILFDIVFNLVAGLPLSYVGKSSLYDIILTKFGGWVKQHPGHFVFIFRFMAMLVWVACIIKEL